ncbi:MAG: type VI secretion system tube protein TssD [Polyangiaceae bacterium]
MPYHFYIKATGQVQGAFTGETPKAGDGRSLCYRFRFKGAVQNDPTRAKGAAARAHEPISVIKPWGASSPEFMAAFWTNEVLDSVQLLFVHTDGKGNPEAPFQEIELTNATIASLEHVAGEGTVVPDGAPAELEEIAFRFEKMSIKNVPGKTAAKYDWANQG